MCSKLLHTHFNCKLVSWEHEFKALLWEKSASKLLQCHYSNVVVDVVSTLIMAVLTFKLAKAANVVYLINMELQIYILSIDFRCAAIWMPPDFATSTNTLSINSRICGKFPWFSQTSSESWRCGMDFFFHWFVPEA